MDEEGRKRILAEFVADLVEQGVKSWTASSCEADLYGVFCLCDQGLCPGVDIMSRNRERLERDAEFLLRDSRFLEEFGGDAARLRDSLSRWIDFRALDERDDLQGDPLLIRGTRYSMDDLHYLFVVYVLKRRPVAFGTAKNYLREMQFREIEARSAGLSAMTLADASPVRVDAAFDELNARKPFTGIAATSVSAWKQMLAALRSGEPFFPRELPFDTLISRFQEYLTDKTSVVASTVNSYVGAMKNVRLFVRDTRRLLLCRLLFSTDSFLVRKAFEQLDSLKCFKRFNKELHRQPSAALGKWVEFIADLESSVESAAEPTPDVSAPVDDPAPLAPASVSAGHTQDWDNIAEAVWGKPLSVSYMGGDETKRLRWRDVYGYIFQKLFELYPIQMNQFVDKSLPLPKRRFPILLSCGMRFSVPLEIKENVWANGNLGVKIFMRNVKETMDCLDVPYSSFTVRYLKRGEVLETSQPSLFDNFEESDALEVGLTESLADEENLADVDALTLDWTNPGDMTNTEPVVVYYNDTAFRFSSWARVYSFMIKELSSHRNGSYNSLMEKNAQSSSHDSCKIRSLCFDEARWLSFDCPPNLVVQKMKRVLEVQRLLRNSPFAIRYRRLATTVDDKR
ncbi:MAG: hypothetical protein ACI4NP_03300 [Thermoguttaceae bacterium]